MNPLIQLKKATPLFVITLVLACFALSPQAFAEVANRRLAPPVTPAVNVGKMSKSVPQRLARGYMCGGARLAGTWQTAARSTWGPWARYFFMRMPM